MRPHSLSWVAGILAGVLLPSGVVAGSQALGSPAPTDGHQMMAGTAALERQPAAGVRLLMSPDMSADGIASCLVLPGGTRSEGPLELGFAELARAHVLAHTPGLSSRGSEAMLAGRGATPTSFLDRDSVSYCVAVPARELPLALWLAARRLGTPPPSKAAVADAATSAREAALQALGESPVFAGRTRLEQLAFQGYAGMEAPPLAGALLLESPEDRWAADYFSRVYRESTAIVTLVGRFDPAYAERVAREQFKTLQPRRPRPAQQQSPEATPQKSGRYSFLTHDRADNVELFFGWVAPEAGTKAHDALVLASGLLASEDGARLRERLISKMKWATAIEGWVGESPGPNLFGLHITMNKRVDLDVVARIVSEEIQKLTFSAPSREELDRAKARAEAGLAAQGDSPAQHALRLGRRTVAFNDTGSADSTGARLASITPADIREAARRYLGPYRVSLVEVYPKKYPIEPSNAPMKRVYLVQGGDTLIGIARSHGVALEALVGANGLSAKSPIFPGQKLVIPPGGKAPPKPVTYVVRKGDTLSGIAKKHGVSVVSITRFNHMNKKKSLSVGQVLTIPPKQDP